MNNKTYQTYGALALDYKYTKVIPRVKRNGTCKVTPFPVHNSKTRVTTPAKSPYIFSSTYTPTHLSLVAYTLGLDTFLGRTIALAGWFVSPDPALTNPALQMFPTDGAGIDPLSFHPYAAFGNNPIKNRDPLGLFNITTGEIESGDNLTQIKNELNSEFDMSLTVNKVANANGISDPNKIKAGDFIKLPFSKNFELRFDFTEMFAWDRDYDAGTKTKLRWKAKSGIITAGRGKAYQRTANIGPLPEGRWIINADQIQHRPTGYFSEWVQNQGVRRANWSGGYNSWGNRRVWFRPGPGTTAPGRDPNSFTIHGGNEFGSAGCIDLAGNAPSFFNWLDTQHGDIDVVADYHNNFTIDF